MRFLQRPDARLLRVLNLYSFITLRLHDQLKLWYSFFRPPFILDVALMPVLVRSTPDIIRRYPLHHPQIYKTMYHDHYLSHGALQDKKQKLPHLIAENRKLS
jgi:hypothetical protein